MTMHSSSSAHASYSLLLTNEKNSPLHTVSTISDTNLCLCSWCILSLLYISRMLISTLSHRAATTERSPREDTARCPVTTPGKAEAMPVSTWAHAFFIQSVKWIIAAWIPVLISPHLYTFLCCRSFRPEAVCRPADQMCRAAWINTDRGQHCLLPSHQQEGGCW